MNEKGIFTAVITITILLLIVSFYFSTQSIKKTSFNSIPKTVELKSFYNQFNYLSDKVLSDALADSVNAVCTLNSLDQIKTKASDYLSTLSTEFNNESISCIATINILTENPASIFNFDYSIKCLIKFNEGKITYSNNSASKKIISISSGVGGCNVTITDFDSNLMEVNIVNGNPQSIDWSISEKDLVK